MSKKTIQRHFSDKKSLMTAVLDWQFEAFERAVGATLEEEEGTLFGEQIQRFPFATCGGFERIDAAQLGTRRGDAVLCRHVAQRIDTIV
ncbi:hypothetical protein [Nocardia anaemiae]|uniref:hypothetical protein n=1 Tax=Nocardia anaemiae TaxID=263910 RepID=UPI0007A4FEB4|nr:hypothetical protein [Nocardia anaemiae]